MAVYQGFEAAQISSSKQILLLHFLENFAGTQGSAGVRESLNKHPHPLIYPRI